MTELRSEARGRRALTVRGLMPEGLDPPADVPAQIFEAALTLFLKGQRLDMSALAADLRMGRATLYRRVGDRERLLGEVIWFLTRRALARALRVGARRRGPDRIAAIAARFMEFIDDQPALRRFLEQEPEAALRILTSKHGPVQSRLVAVTARALELEAEAGTLRLPTDARTLAYVIVRIGEGFLYADVIADNEPDLAKAREIFDLLLAPLAVG